MIPHFIGGFRIVAFGQLSISPEAFADDAFIIIANRTANNKTAKQPSMRYLYAPGLIISLSVIFILLTECKMYIISYHTDSITYLTYNLYQKIGSIS